MNRVIVALFSAFEAVVIAGVGLGVALAPLTIVWAVQFHLAIGWGVFWQIAGDAWLMGHGVDLGVDIGRAAATSLGLSGAVEPFTVTIAALGIAFFTFAMGARMGYRAAESDRPAIAGVTGVVVFGIIGWIVALSSASKVVAPVTWQGAVLPALVLALGFALGLGLQAARSRPPTRDAGASGPFSSAGITRMPQTLRLAAAGGIRAGVAAAALIVAASAVLVSLALLFHFGSIVTLYESLHSGYLGGVTLTLTQLAVLPNAVVWAGSWLIGPGFAVGSGTSVGIGGVSSGALPGIPLFGLLPAHAPALGFVGILVPVLAGFASGLLLRLRSRSASADPLTVAVTAVATGVVAGIVLGLAAWWSSGALAPGSLAELGPDGLKVALFAALEVAIGSAVGLLAVHYRRIGQQHPEDTSSSAEPSSTSAAARK